VIAEMQPDVIGLQEAIRAEAPPTPINQGIWRRSCP
jgi:hypothetical protein